MPPRAPPLSSDCRWSPPAIAPTTGQTKVVTAKTAQAPAPLSPQSPAPTRSRLPWHDDSDVVFECSGRFPLIPISVRLYLLGSPSPTRIDGRLRAETGGLRSDAVPAARPQARVAARSMDDDLITTRGQRTFGVFAPPSAPVEAAVAQSDDFDLSQGMHRRSLHRWNLRSRCTCGCFSFPPRGGLSRYHTSHLMAEVVLSATPQLPGRLDSADNIATIQSLMSGMSLPAGGFPEWTT